MSVLRAKLKARLLRHATRISQRVRSVRLLPPDPLALWDESPEFIALLDRVRGHTLVDPWRCFILQQLVRQVTSVAGDCAEIGVYRGGTARLISETIRGTSKTLHLFDTFEGMPETDPGRDRHRAGDFSDVSLGAVRDYLRDCDRVVFHPGFFPATANELPEEARFSLVHVDVDIHRSVLDCCTFFYPRLNRGGALVFDDYGFRSCPGARAAVDEFFAGRSEQPIYLPTGQAVVIKL